MSSEPAESSPQKPGEPSRRAQSAALAPQAAPNRGALRALDRIEKAGDRLPEPLVLFGALLLLVFIASALASLRGVAATHTSTGVVVRAVSLFSAEALRALLASAVSSFMAFPQLGTAIVVLLGLGIAERSGFLPALLKRVVAIVPGWALIGGLVFLGVNSGVSGEVGLIFLLPLGALLFAAMGRHPIAGLAAVFGAGTAGFGASVLVTPLDSTLATWTESAARTLDASHEVGPAANRFFTTAAALLLTGAAMLVNRAWVEPRLGQWTREAAAADDNPRALRLALVAFGSTLLVVLAMVVPEHGFLRDSAGKLTAFHDGLGIVVLILFVVAAAVYGYHAGTFPDHGAFVKSAGEAAAGLGPFLVLAFAAAQLTACFNASQLGPILAIKTLRLFYATQPSGLPLVAAVFFVAAVMGLVLPGAAARWAILTPVVVPLFLASSYSPEAAQATFRSGNAITSGMTPLLPVLPLFIALVKRHRPRAGAGTVAALTLPYSAGLGLAWAALIFGWILLGLPLGPGAPVHGAAPHFGAPLVP